MLSDELTRADTVFALPLRRGDLTVHDEMIIHGSGGTFFAEPVAPN